MNAKEIKAAATRTLTRYLEKGATETSTADYTAVVYPDLQSIIVQWVVEKNGREIEKNRTFAITLSLKK